MTALEVAIRQILTAQTGIASAQHGVLRLNSSTSTSQSLGQRWSSTYLS